MRNLLQDLRLGLRALTKNTGFTTVAILTLALGIGANTAIFTLVDAVMLKDLPVAKPGELYRVGTGDNCCVIGGFQDNWGIYSFPLYQELRDHTPEFSEMAAFQGGTTDLSVRRSGSSSPAEPFGGEYVSGNYFSMFGLQAFAGRLIAPGDDEPSAPRTAVMSYRAWQHFGLDRSVIGSTVTFNTVPLTVIGVAPPGFYGDRLRPDPPDFWLPLAVEPALARENSLLKDPGGHWLYAIGRLNAAASPASVESELTIKLKHWLAAQPNLNDHERAELGKQQIQLGPGGAGISELAHDSGSGLRLLMIVSGLVLVIACANLANLLLARGAMTRLHTAIRASLGAPRWRLIRQTLVESLLLALLGGLAGLYVAYATSGFILMLAFRGSHYVPISTEPSLQVLGFAFGLSLVTAIAFGIWPAWMNSRSDPAEALRGAGRATRDRATLARRALVVAQVALSTVLLIGAGLVTQSLRNLENQKYGIEPEGRLIVRVDPSLAGYTLDKLPGFYQQLRERLPQLPGVRSAAYSLYSPMQGDNWEDSVHMEGHPPDERVSASFNFVSPHYFETVGTRLLLGRPISEQDTPTSRAVAVVNDRFARKYFPKQNPIGKHFGLEKASHSGDYEIVGVVEDAKYNNAREPANATFFLPYFQHVKDEPDYLGRGQFIGTIELWLAGKPENLEAAVRRTLADIDPNFTVISIVPLPEQVAQNFNQDRLIARLTELFGALALILASVGLYGVMSYSVARRTNEIGIRMALGAGRKSVLGMVLRSALIQTAMGLGIGVPAALGLGRFLASTLFGVKTYDPGVLAVAIAVLSASTFLAGLIPARRATKVDPMTALRYE